MGCLQSVLSLMASCHHSSSVSVLAQTDFSHLPRNFKQKSDRMSKIIPLNTIWMWWRRFSFGRPHPVQWREFLSRFCHPATLTTNASNHGWGGGGQSLKEEAVLGHGLKQSLFIMIIIWKLWQCSWCFSSSNRALIQPPFFPICTGWEGPDPTHLTG